MNLESMTIDELVAANQELGVEIDALREKRREINAVRDRKIAAQRIEQLGLSEQDLETLRARGPAQPAKG